MNTEKIKTLEQIQDALDIVENARTNQMLSPNEKHELEAAAIRLRNLERSIIKTVQLELIESLTADSQTLKDLAVRITQASNKLDKVAVAINKAANVVESFIKIVTTIVSAGLL